MSGSIPDSSISRRAPRHPEASARRSQLSKLNSRDAHSTSQSSCYTACDNARHSSAAPSSSPLLLDHLPPAFATSSPLSAPPPPPAFSVSPPPPPPALRARRGPPPPLGGDLLPQFCDPPPGQSRGDPPGVIPTGRSPYRQGGDPPSGGGRSPKGGEVPPRFPYETAPHYIPLLCIPLATFLTNRSRN